MSRAFLQPSPYARVVVEMDSAPGAAPDASVVNNFMAVLGGEARRSTTLAGGHDIAGKNGGCWTLDDVVGAANRERHVHTGNGAAALMVLFLDGHFCADANVLGAAFGASYMMVFTQVVAALGTPTVPGDRYLDAVTVHELGHILGLVNFGYHSRVDHEDPQNPHHSNNPNSVMYYAIDRANVVQRLATGPPQKYDASDEADLAGLRDGTY